MQNIVEFYKKLYHENFGWIKNVAILFTIAAVVGGVIFFAKPSLLSNILNTFRDQFGTAPVLNFHLVVKIFLKNILASSIALFGGIILGLAPLFVVATNGILLGFVITSVLTATQSQPLFGLMILAGGILPHGILELPAFLIASAFGLRLGIEWLSVSARGQRLTTLKKNIMQGLAVIPVVGLLLFIAAIVEVYISGRIVDILR